MPACPTTTRIKGYPFEVVLAGTRLSVALADQVKSLDWQTRRTVRESRVSAGELREIRGKAISLIAGE
ncbi:MAG: type II toxin-antitoxin system PemK/MazF family toxin [Acetobacteraceae bacterium]